MANEIEIRFIHHFLKANNLFLATVVEYIGGTNVLVQPLLYETLQPVSDESSYVTVDQKEVSEENISSGILVGIGMESQRLHSIIPNELIPWLIVGLSHEDENTRLYFLNDILSKSLTSFESVQYILDSSPSVFFLLITLLHDLSLAVSESTTSILITCATLSEACTMMFFSPKTLDHLFSTDNSVYLVRDLTLYCKIGSGSSNNFQLLKQSQVLQNNLFSVLQINKEDADILLQVSLLEVIREISYSLAGLRFLGEVHLLSIIEPLTLSDFSIFSIAVLQLVISLTNASKKFSCDSWLDIYAIMRILSRALVVSSDQEVLETAVVAVCSLCVFSSGLDAMTSSSQHFLDRIPPLAASSKPALKASVFQGLSIFLDEAPSTNPEFIHALQLRCIERLGEGSVVSGMNLIFSAIQGPQGEDNAMQAAFDLLISITRHHYGPEMILRAAGLFEYLTNRQAHANKTAIDMSFSVLTELSKNASLPNFFPDGSAAKHRLEQYLQEGAYYSARIAQVIVDDEAG